jgi:hypothetical protein
LRTLGIGFVLGVACAAFIDVIWKNETERAVNVVAPTGGVADAPRLPVAAPSTEDCGRDLARLESRVADLRAALSLHGGTPEPWPDDAPLAATEIDLTAWLPIAAHDFGLPVTLLAIDCEEYPCMAVFAYDDGVPADSNVVQPIRGRYLEVAGGAGGALVHVVGTEAGAFAVVAFQGVDDPPAMLGTRTAMRIGDLVATHTP